MLTYTHVTRIGTGKDADGKGTYKTVETPSTKIPLDKADILTMTDDPYWSEVVEVTLNEQSKEHKRVVKMTRLAKAVANSIGLNVNAKARQGEGINPMKYAAEVLSSLNDDDAADGVVKAEIIAIMSTGDSKRLRAWCEAYEAKANGEE